MLDEELMSEAFRFDHCLIFVFCVLWYIVSGYLTDIFPIELLLVENYWKGEVLTKLAMLDTEKDGDSGINELMEDGRGGGTRLLARRKVTIFKRVESSRRV